MTDDIRKLPAQDQRVETGPVQFGDDWPGVFIRGDNAYAYAMAVRQIMRGTADPFAGVMLAGLVKTLSSSDLTGLSKLPDDSELGAEHFGAEGK